MATRILKLSALLLLASAGCSPYAHGNGVYGQETRTVPIFDGVSIGPKIVCTVRAGAAETSVTISGDENVLQYIKTEVIGGVLTTRLSGIDDFQSDHQVQLVVATPLLKSVDAHDGARIVASSIVDKATFTATASKGSTVTLAGDTSVVAATLVVSASDTSAIDALAYPTVDATIDLSTASASVHATGTVTGTIAGNSTLDIQGGATCAGVTSTGAGAACKTIP
jgi:hypothetical protein